MLCYDHNSIPRKHNTDHAGSLTIHTINTATTWLSDQLTRTPKQFTVYTVLHKPDTLCLLMWKFNIVAWMACNGILTCEYISYASLIHELFIIGFVDASKCQQMRVSYKWHSRVRELKWNDFCCIKLTFWHMIRDTCKKTNIFIFHLIPML